MIEALTHREMLDKIGGDEKLPAKAREWSIRKALNWHTKAKSAIRHLLAGEQKFSPQEERDVEAGFMRFCADQIRRHHEEDRQYLATIRSSIDRLESIDPDFHRPAIQALGELADCLRGVAGEAGGED
jgi:hypothetical protein